MTRRGKIIVNEEGEYNEDDDDVDDPMTTKKKTTWRGRCIHVHTESSSAVVSDTLASCVVGASQF